MRYCVSMECRQPLQSTRTESLPDSSRRSVSGRHQILPAPSPSDTNLESALFWGQCPDVFQPVQWQCLGCRSISQNALPLSTSRFSACNQPPPSHPYRMRLSRLSAAYSLCPLKHSGKSFPSILSGGEPRSLYRPV